MLILTVENGKAIYIGDMKLTVFPHTDSEGKVEVDYYLTFPESSLQNTTEDTFSVDSSSSDDVHATLD